MREDEGPLRRAFVVPARCGAAVRGVRSVDRLHGRARMHRSRFHRPSPALVVACIALLVALSGTGYAAVVLPRASVGTIQLKNGAVNSLKVKDSSLTLLDVAPAERANLKGDAGAAGAKGDTGAK